MGPSRFLLHPLGATRWGFFFLFGAHLMAPKWFFFFFFLKVTWIAKDHLMAIKWFVGQKTNHMVAKKIPHGGH